MMPDSSNPSNDSDSTQIDRVDQDVRVRGDGNQTIGQVLGGMVIYGTVIFNNPLAEADAFTAKTKDLKIGANPYKGLLAFQETDGDRFFGRDLQIKELWEKFRSLHEEESATRLLIIYGPSGSGKSSVARAGLIPELAHQPVPGRDRARVAVLVPSTHPLKSLAAVLAQIATDDLTPVAKTREFATELAQVNSQGVYDGLQQIADLLPKIEISPLIVLVDQLEEVFTLCEEPAERDAFIGNLLCAATDRSKRVSAIFTLSSDFLGATQNYPQLNELIASQHQSYLLTAMSKEGLREAIAKPAELAGHPLDLSTVNLLIEQTADREGALPLLQFALTRIWVGLAAGTAPAETLRSIGGVGGALAGEAQRIYESLPAEEQEIARRIFLGLVQLGEGSKDTRRRTDLERVVSHWDSLEQVQRVIARFSAPGARLITLAADGGTETAEVTHEALFENWKQLKNWIDSSRSDLRFQRRLEEAAEIWRDHERHVGNLWQSPTLDLLREFQERAGDDLTPLQLEFFQASKESARWRKLQEISSYCIFGSLATLCFFLTKNIDVEYIMAKTIAQMQDKHTFFVTKPVFSGDKRNDYYYDLLRLVLENGYADNKNRNEIIDKIEIRTRKMDSNQGRKTDALNISEKDSKNQKIDIDWMMPNNDRDALANRIDFPINFGLLSHRLCLVNSNKADIGKISDKNSFIKAISITQVKYWPDIPFLESRKEIRLIKTENYKESMNQLLDSSNNVNCFLRGLNEIHIEQKQLMNKENKDFPKATNLSVSNNFLFQYYSPENFYVALKDKDLSKKIDAGLNRTLKSGELLCIYKKHYGHFIKDANLKKSKKIFIDRVKLKEMTRPELYLDFTKDYEDIFKNIKKQEKTHMNSFQCDKLFERLRKANKQLRF